MSILKIGGKNDSNNVQGFGVTNEGYAKTTRFWNTTITQIFSETISDRTVKTTIENVFNCEEWGFISLRFANSTNVKMTCNVYSDMGSSSLQNYLKDNNGNPITFEIPTGQSILTPDDLPILNYLKWLKLRIEPNEVPATPNTLTISIYAKR